MQDYFDNLYEAIKEFDKFNKDNTMPEIEDPPTPRVIKPLYLLIKLDVDADIVYNQAKAHTYAESHCNKMEYELVDYFYPNDDHHHSEHPFIKLWRNTSDYWQSSPTAL